MSIKKLFNAESADVLLKTLENYESRVEFNEVGYVISVKDNIATAQGLDAVQMSELVEFEDGARGMVLNIEQDTVDIVLLEAITSVREGSVVKRTHNIISLPVGFEMLSRIVNALGDPIDGGEAIHTSQRSPIECEAPGVIDRQSVHEPVNTGYKVIDALIPIGRGQRELIIGDRRTGKTTIAMDIIINQKKYNDGKPKKEKIYCVYVAIGQKQSSVVQLHKRLEQAGAMEYTSIVFAGAADSVAMQYIAPYSGCTIAEYFRDRDMHCIIVYDDLSKQAIAYRALSLLLRNPPGREAYPGDVFYLHSRLLERAGKLSAEKGGGSLTAFPIVETQADDVSSYIPTNVISITDGQIFLNSKLFHSGILPAINIGLSVSRVGSSAQTKLMKTFSGSTKLDLAQYRELKEFSRFGSDLDSATQKILAKGNKLVELFKQNQHATLSLPQQTLLLYTNRIGLLDTLEMQQVSSFEKHLLEFVEATKPELFDQIQAAQELTHELETAMKTIIHIAHEDFIKQNNE